MASPFAGRLFTFTQPDGTEFEVRGWGDQHYAVFETIDGYTVVRNPSTGYFEVARISRDRTMLEPAPGPQGNLDGALAGVPKGLRIDRDAARSRGIQGAMTMGGRRCDRRREDRRSLARAAGTLRGPAMAPPQRGTVGDFVGLCLLIDFSDEHGTISRGEVEKFCNEPGYSGFDNHGSVSDYFRDNSLGRCRYTNIVTDYYRAAHPKTHYTDPAIPQGVRARQLIVEALNHWKAAGFDFSPLTADGDGFVYAMNVYYSGPVVNNWSEGLWPHAWSLGSPVSLAPGKSAFDYQFTDMSDELSLGTFCHENGHMLCDYPDLYDYGGESSGVGAYCLMCAGGNIDEKSPVHISAYLKRLSGWAGSVTPIRHGQRIELPAGGNDFAVFPKSSTEYFIIENRAKTGRDESLPDAGLAVWHVDELGSNNREQMTPTSHYELSLEQADGDFRLEGSRFHLGDGTDLFGETKKRFTDATTPNSKWWDGTASQLDLYEIGAPGPKIAFRARLFPDDGGGSVVTGESRPELVIPDNVATGVSDTITIARDATIASARITLDISHTYRGDLKVTLLPPFGEGIVLHQRHQGTSGDDIRTTLDEAALPTLAALKGRGTRGDWSLLVQDLAAADQGTLHRWALEFDASAKPAGPVVLEEAPGAHVPDNDPAGIERSLTTDAAGKVGGIEVSVDITHTWIGDLTVILKSPGGSEILLHGGTGGQQDDLRKTWTPSTTPALDSLLGQSIDGAWRLHVSDHAGQDVGKLNSWKAVITPE